MAQYIAIRALNRSVHVRVIDQNGNKVRLSTTVDTIIDLDRADNRIALNHHHSVGQYIVTAANAADGAVALPANS